MIGALIERLSALSGTTICLAVGTLALLETAAFAGLAVPGETAVLLGGVVAFEGRVSLTAVAVAAVVGAILGDSVGFWLGRRLGNRVLGGRLGRLMGRERVDRSMARIRAGGMKAVILGRFVGVLRAVMPFAAGSSGMSYLRFLVASVLGATAWGTGFTLLGYAAGNSWRRVEGYAGAASTVLAVVVVLTVVVVWLARRAVRRQDRLRARWQQFRERPRIAALRRRYGRQIDFTVARFRPGPAAGLQLTVSLLALAVLGFVLALLAGQVLRSVGVSSVDGPVRDAMLRSQTPTAVGVMETVRLAVSPAALLVVAALVGAVTWAVDRRPRCLVLLAAAMAGSLAVAELVGVLVGRPQPLFASGILAVGFPSRQDTIFTATVVGLLAVVVPRIGRWTRTVLAVAVGLGVVLLGGLSGLYLAEVYLSDLAGGVVLGALWGLLVATAVSTAWPSAGRRTSSEAPPLAREPRTEPATATAGLSGQGTP